MDIQKHLTLGVAGHVDHGKTALVRALTGTQTDRLKEEQERGMSIVLGFAHLALPGGELDLIDVPGHEKFVRTMISGATGIDAALLVIAVNERVKPQTAEHVAVMGLLGVKSGLVVITKCDLMPDAGERALVAEEVQEFLHETFLRDAPILFTSVMTGEGLGAVRQALEAVLGLAVSPVPRPYFYLPIDRAFTITGHGTVVTGTLRRGPLRLGQPVELWPRGGKAEVRGLEVHGQPVEAALPGWRTAVNLRGVKKEDLARGDALATVGFLRPTRLLDAEFTLLPSVDKPIKRGQTVHLCSGTAEHTARVYPLGQDVVAPGETAFVQFRLTADAVVPTQEPFLVRAYSPAATIGGGVIVDPYPQKRARSGEDARRHVQVLAHGSPAEKLWEKLRDAGPEGRDLSQLMTDLALAGDPLMLDAPIVRCAGSLVLHPVVFEELTAQARGLVHDFHLAHPTRRGMPQEELRRSLPRGLRPAGYHRLLETLTRSGQLETGDGLVREAGYSPEAAFSPVEREIVREIEALFECGGLKPPGLAEVLKKDRRRKTLYFFLVEAGALIPTTERTTNHTVVFHRDAVAEAERRLQEALSPGEGRTVSELNTLLNTTRKFSIPLLEYLDEKKVTRRVGDLRFWNEGR